MREYSCECNWRNKKKGCSTWAPPSPPSLCTSFSSEAQVWDHLGYHVAGVSAPVVLFPACLDVIPEGLLPMWLMMLMHLEQQTRSQIHDTQSLNLRCGVASGLLPLLPPLSAWELPQSRSQSGKQALPLPSSAPYWPLHKLQELQIGEGQPFVLHGKQSQVMKWASSGSPGWTICSHNWTAAALQEWGMDPQMHSVMSPDSCPGWGSEAEQGHWISQQKPTMLQYVFGPSSPEWRCRCPVLWVWRGVPHVPLSPCVPGQTWRWDFPCQTIYCQADDPQAETHQAAHW